uniref:Chitosanase n=1 Tax=Pseudomonas sp. A-01 TaxID=201382 RepID=Q8KZM5_9PSED|nr:chitosanase [Pseudomonas sp. A-01]
MKIQRLVALAAAVSLSIGLSGCAASVEAAGTVDLDAPVQKDTAMSLVSSFENSSTDWQAQYGYLEDIADGRGYTGGLIGFTSGTGDMLELVRAYSASSPGNPLEQYIPALEAVNGTDSHAGLGQGFEQAWADAAETSEFRAAQDAERDRVYFDPAVAQGKADGLSALGQFVYYDTLVVHGPGSQRDAFGGIRAEALSAALPPSQGGDETEYLEAFFDARNVIMREEPAHADTSRIDTAQRVFLQNGNFDLERPLTWSVYGDQFSLN